MRRSTLFLTLIASGIGLGLFQLKYTVMNSEQKYKQIISSIKTTRESIHVLKAEWAHLNDPKRLQALAVKHLDVHPITPNQLVPWKNLSTPPKMSAPKETDQEALNDLVASLANDSLGGHA